VADLGYESMDVGMGGVASFRVFVRDACKVFDSHMNGSVSHWWWADTRFFYLPLYSFCGEVGKKAYCLSRGFINYAVYGGELSIIKYPEVCGVVLKVVLLLSYSEMG
jgi:hypothetical protein